MKKKLLTAIIGIIFCSATYADNSLDIAIEVPGTLKERVLDSDYDLIESLTVSGRLNAADLEYLGSASGLISHIKTLDIRNVNFVLDGGMYRETNVSSGSMGVNEINQYVLWPRDSVSGYSTLNGYVNVYWGNNLAAAFTDSKFEKVMLPESLDAIGSSAFANAMNLKEIVMGGHEKYIGSMAFKGAQDLSIISLAVSVDSIGNNAFEQAGNGLELDLSYVSKFGWECFKESGISSVILPNIDVDLSPNMFSGCDQLSAITIPENFKVISDGMFYGCASLTNVTIENGLEKIGSSAFYGCPLESIHLPNSVKVIGADAFHSCENLSDINYPDNLEVLGNDSFRYTKVEQSFPIDNAISYFGTAAYKAQNYLPSHVIFREGTTILAGGLFDASILIKPGYSDSEWAYSIVNSVELPESIKHIGDNVFKDTNITAINFPQHLESIGDGAFKNIPLESIIFPSSLRRIGSEAFATSNGFRTLRAVEFPEGLEEIGKRAFSNQLLSVITLPESLNYFGGQAFSYNTSLVTINYNCRDAVVDLTESFYDATCSPFYGSSCERINFGQNVKAIPDELFNMKYSNDFNVSKIELPTGIQNIGSKAFKLSSLTSINFPEGLESIGNSAFYESGLVEAQLPNSLKQIGYEAFYRTKLTVLSLKENVEFIGNNAFGEISTLETIDYDCRDANTDYRIVESQFGPYEFFGKPFDKSTCNNIIFGPNVKNLSPYFFSKIEGVSDIVLPEGCTLGQGVFSEIGTLKSVKLPEDLTTIPAMAFSNCYCLEQLTIPQSVEIIGDYAFSNCYALNISELPVFIEEIGDRAFNSGAFKGNEINLGPNIVRVGEGAFAGCWEVNRIFIPRQLNEIGNGAFNITPDYASYDVTVISMLEDPSVVSMSDKDIFSDNCHWSLRVPYGTEDIYQSTPSWATFSDYAVNGDMTIDLNKGYEADFASVNGHALDGFIIGGIYYSFKNVSCGDNTDYLTLDGTWKIADESLFDILTPFNYDLTQFFYGIALKLPEGEGHIKIDSENPETSLVVKIAGKEPVEFTNQSLQANIVDFSLPEDTFVYIYSENEGKSSTIRSLSINPGQSGIDEVNDVDESNPTESYFPDGRPASPASKGILIERLGNGTSRKVIRR